VIVTYIKELGWEKAASFRLLSSLLLCKVGNVLIKILVCWTLSLTQCEGRTFSVMCMDRLGFSGARRKPEQNNNIFLILSFAQGICYMLV